MLHGISTDIPAKQQGSRTGKSSVAHVCPSLKGLEKQGETDKTLNVQKEVGGMPEDMFLTEGTFTDFRFRLKHLSTILLAGME